jgi:hypothetical protein
MNSGMAYGNLRRNTRQETVAARLDTDRKPGFWKLSEEVRRKRGNRPGRLD